MKKTIIGEIIVALFIVLFVYAAFTKLLEFDKFRVQLTQSPMITSFASWLSFGVPVVEILIAIMLAVNKTRLIGFYAAFTLMVLFSTYILVMLNFSSYIPCSCGGILEKLGWTEHLIFNFGFVLLGIAGVVLYSKKAEYTQSQLT